MLVFVFRKRSRRGKIETLVQASSQDRGFLGREGRGLVIKRRPLRGNCRCHPSIHPRLEDLDFYRKSNGRFWIWVFNFQFYQTIPPLTLSLCSDSKAAGVYSQFLHFYDVITIKSGMLWKSEVRLQVCLSEPIGKNETGCSFEQSNTNYTTSALLLYCLLSIFVA